MRFNIKGRLQLVITLLLLAVPSAHISSQPTLNESAIAKDSSTEINVNDADIAAIIRIFSKKTKRNYILDERVKGKVSIYLPGKISTNEAIRILDSVLALKGFTSVPIGDNLWKIVSAKEAKQTTIPTIEKIDGRGSAVVVTKMINLKYVSADDAKQLITPLVSSSGLVSAYTGTNALILVDSEENIKRLMELISSIDIPFTDSEMTIIPIKHAEAKDIAEKINQILNDDSQGNSSGSSSSSGSSIRAKIRENISNSSTRNASSPTAKGGTTATASVTVSARARAPKLIADERTNSIVLVADEDTTARIRALIDQLDSPIDLSGSGFYVYRCQHASAEELAEVLSGLVGGNSSSGSSRRTSTSSSNSDSTSSQNRQARSSRSPGQSLINNNRSGGVASANIGEDISITADAATNSLIINASRSDYLKVLELLQDLDIKRRQVLVEAMLLEVAIDDNLNTSFEFANSFGGRDGGVFGINPGPNLQNIFQNPLAISQFSVAVASSGTLSLPGGVTLPTQTALLSMARANSNVNVLSSPNILATDNEEAEIVVGENVPFLASTATNATDLNNTFNQIDRQDVGITLRITPQISSSDFVTLRIFTEVSNVVDSTEASALGPTTTVRTSQTTVITKDNQMIVMGGLMSDNVTESERGIPFIKDIPFVGQFFKTRIESQSRTNLLIFITPRIIQDQFDARDATIDKRDRVEESIDAFDVHPDRKEVLKSFDIDRVSEVSPEEIAAPSTIRGPDTTKKVSKVDNSIRSALELSTSPELPKLNGTGSKGASNSPMRKEQITVSTLNAVRAGGKFIVLQVKDSELPEGLPFKVQSGGLVGLSVPSESTIEAKSFFQAGELYKFGGEEEGLSLRALGVFSSQEEAEQFYTTSDTSWDENSWYSLAPHEIINLGSGPWRVAANKEDETVAE